MNDSGKQVDLLPLREQAVWLAAMILLCSLFLSMFSNLKQAIPVIRPFYLDEVLMEADRFLHGGRHPWELLHPMMGFPLVTKIVDGIYFSWFAVLFLFLVGFCLISEERLRSRFFASFILIWIIAGTIFAVLLSSSGPCYYAKVNSGVDPFLPLMKYLHSVHGEHFLFAVKFQKGIWNAHEAGRHLPFGGISAMPSIHVAMAMLFACGALSLNKFFGLIVSFYAFFIQVGSVHLGWHYAIDGYMGILIVILIWKLSGWIYTDKI